MNTQTYAFGDRIPHDVRFPDNKSRHLETRRLILKAIRRYGLADAPDPALVMARVVRDLERLAVSQAWADVAWRDLYDKRVPQTPRFRAWFVKTLTIAWNYERHRRDKERAKVGIRRPHGEGNFEAACLLAAGGVL